jgi:hypothetical protein
VALALAAALSVPQPASAQAAPDERAAAREFAYAAYRLRVRIKDAAPAMRRAGAVLDSRACRSAFPDEELDVERLPRRVQLGFGVVFHELELGVVYGVVHDHFSTFVAELDRVVTADPVLAAARENWRSAVEFIAEIRPLPADTCSRLRRWRLDGYPFDRLPILQPEPVHSMLVKESSRPRSEARPEADDVSRRVCERLVELGVTPGQARRFTGSTLFVGVLSGLLTD